MSRAATRSATPTSTVSGPTGPLALLDVPAAPPEGVAERAAVLLVPGFTGSKEDFDPVLAMLAAAGHRAVAMDLRGQHESDGPDTLAGDQAAVPYAPAALAEDLLAVRDRLGLGRCHLVGHSYGGLVGRAAVLADPGAWASLVLLDSGPAAIGGERRASTELLGVAARTVALPELWEAVTAYWAAEGREQPPPEAADFQRQRFTGSRAEAVVGMAHGLLHEPDRVEELLEAAAGGGVALAVVFGADDDAWLPAEQREMAARLGAPVVEIPGAVHSPAVEQPEATAAALVALLADAEAARVTG